MTGFQLNERLGKIHFWTMFIAFNSTFAPLFALGFLGQPRRVVTYPHEPPVPERLGLGLARSCSASRCSSSSTTSSSRWCSRACPPPANPWGSRSIEWQLPSPVPVHNFDRIPVFSSDPYGYGEGPAPVGGSRRRSGGRD